MSNIKKLETYIDNLHTTGVSKGIMIVEHRSNNPKRDYLFVNRKQGKHIPVRPSDVTHTFSCLSEKVRICTDGYRNVLVIGFAETATAIGNFVASHIGNCKYYLQTTREDIKDCDILVEFEEKHSHAVEQRIYSSQDITKMGIDYVLFVEDEISTGKTILNCIEKLEVILGNNVKYGVASICNWQNDNNKAIFESKGIDRFYLIGGQLKDENMKMDILPDDIADFESSYSNKLYTISKVCGSSGQLRPERVGYEPYNVNNFGRMVASIPLNILNRDGIDEKTDKILVLGTEEFMYIPLLVAEELERCGYQVYNHATSRSSIDVLNNLDINDGGIKNKVKLPSAYDDSRETYLYNLAYYDKVFVVTDAEKFEGFANELVDRFVKLGVGAENIHFIEVQKV